MSDAKLGKPLNAGATTRRSLEGHAPMYKAGRVPMPTAKQLRDLDARIERNWKDAVQTLADIRAIGRR